MSKTSSKQKIECLKGWLSTLEYYRENKQKVKKRVKIKSLYK